MAEPIPAAKLESLDYLRGVVNDPTASEARRDKCAALLAQLSNYSLGVKGPSNNAVAVRDGANGHAPAPVMDPAGPMLMSDAMSMLAGCVGELAQRLVALEQRNAKLEA